MQAIDAAKAPARAAVILAGLGFTSEMQVYCAGFLFVINIIFFSIKKLGLDPDLVTENLIPGLDA